MLVYHGTSADNLKSIKRDGLVISTDKIWTASLEQVYFWTDRYLDMEYPDWKEDGINPSEYLRKQAADSAMCAAAKAKDCRLVVVVCDIPEDEILVDNSCPNMEGASCIDRSILPSEIVEIWVSNDLGLLRGYFIALMMERELNAIEFSPLEMEIGKIFTKAQLYSDTIDDIITWRKYATKNHN
jgi:hypothetical protein